MSINDITSDKCITPDCPRASGDPKTYRGLCLRCYSSAKKLVESGSYSLEKLEEMGLVLPTYDPFREAVINAEKARATGAK